MKLILMLLGVVLSSETLAQERKVIAVYEGQYLCSQGATTLTVRLLQRLPGARVDEAIFEFGPTPENPGVPKGAFILGGRLPQSNGAMTLGPGDWLQQPPGYSQVGLVGTSTDGGASFQGRIASDSGRCTTFSIKRI